MSATSASIRHQEREILRNTYNQNMKEFVIHVISVNIKQHKEVALKYTLRQSMKNLTILVISVNIKYLGTKIGLKLHVKSFHAEQDYSCDQCEYKATQKWSLKTHVESIHKESCSLNDTVVQTVYIKDDQVSGLNEESKLCENTWGVLDILDDKETTTEDNNETKVSLKEEVLSTTMFMNRMVQHNVYSVT